MPAVPCVRPSQGSVHAPAKGVALERFQLARGLGDEQTHLPVAGVKSQRDGFAVFRAQTAVRAQDQKLRIEQPRRIPSHAGILRQAEEIAGGLGEQHLRRERQRARGTCRVRGDAQNLGAAILQNRVQ